MLHASEPWQAVAAVRSARDEKVVSYLTEYKESALVYWHVEIGIRALGYRELGNQLPELELTLTPATRRELSQVINNHSIPTLISQAPGPSQKRSRSPSSPSYPDATTFSDGKPASETPKLNPEDVMTRLEDIEVEIDTLRADTEDKELLISELQDSLAAAENEIALLQIRVTDAEDRRAEDHDQIQIILARLGL
ncbi:hypothetical protein Tco_1155301 [Tanacetum coccineum]